MRSRHGPMTALIHHLKRFRRDQRGVAATEFGLILPVLVLLLFGGYLNYEKVLGPIGNGYIDERIGPIERAAEPGWFWYSIAFYSVISLGLAFAGATAAWFALRR